MCECVSVCLKVVTYKNNIVDQISIKNIAKFDGTNFQLCKFRVLRVLKFLQLKDYVTGDKMRSEEDGQEAERKEWDKNESRAGVFHSSVKTDEQLNNLLTCETAKEMWNKLFLLHEVRSRSNKNLLLQRFHQYSMESRDTVI